MNKGSLMPFHLSSFRQCVIKQSLVVGLLGSVMQLSFAASDTPIVLPLVTKSNFEYIGAFRVPNTSTGDSRVAGTEGPITLGPDGKTFFMVGHKNQQAIAEFSIPELSSSTDVDQLNMASFIQPFAKVLDRPQSGNTQNINRIGGMEYIDGELVVNTYEFYDADTSVTDTTLVVRDASNLKGSVIAGYHGYQAKAHASGWISPIPFYFEATLGGKYIAGFSGGVPIKSRLSLGPSAFAINPLQDILGERAPSVIPTTTLLDFNLDNIVGNEGVDNGSYLRNDDRTNKLWTHLSRAVYGFIVPGTRSYVTIGFSGGHASGVGYKVVQDDETDRTRTCPGYCSNSGVDDQNYYWLWDLNDLVAVKNGKMNPYEVIPYAYGEFDTPFQNSTGINKSSGLNEIVGGTFDSSTSILYLTLKNADKNQSQYDSPPLIIAYKLPAPLNAPSGVSVE